MADLPRFENVVARPCSHLMLRPLPGTRFNLYLDDKKQTRIRLEFQKGGEREMALHLIEWIDRYLMPFVPLPAAPMPTATELLDPVEDDDV